MRPLRFLLSLASCIIAFCLLLYIGPWGVTAGEDLEERASVGAYFNWRTPSSLFPPSAIVSLTDDNSTFFLARPAAFGPLLPAKSLSGQLWVGSGFGDDHLGRGGPGAGAEGELGCSDIPDWSDGSYRGSSGNRKVADGKSSTVDVQSARNGKSKRGTGSDDEEDEDDVIEQPTEEDGTDDHLHHPLSPSDGLRSGGVSAGITKKPAHADIQSLQEGAEIAGKVVLLSRGGCGFLEKVKWVQRRGGVALIVGDDIRGGPLVTMYARGDTSNVSIPSLFTSHTTAHLLSSLIPSGGILDDLLPEEAARLGLAMGEGDNGNGRANGKEGGAEKPNFTTTSAAVKATSSAKARPKSNSGQHGKTEEVDTDSAEVGWLRSLFGAGHSPNRREDSRRPPSSGSLGWVLQEDFEESDADVRQATSSTRPAAATTKAAKQEGGDGFVIGVQDWRDPDLVAEQKERQQASTSTSTTTSPARSSKLPKGGPLKGGSITPGSGEYGKAAHEAVDLVGSSKSATHKSSGSNPTDAEHQGSGSWISRLFRPHKDSRKEEATTQHTKSNDETLLPRPSKEQGFHRHHQDITTAPHHEGLWVTLTPTSMSSSPFFDTLLVLVVSPLVTLTVVYALLLLRSRIRRRRWRAPKSVVERLPVRTYQTMPASNASTTTSSTTSTVSSPVTASTPLLPTGARAINNSARSRPRSRTASEVPVQPSSSLRSAGEDMASPSLEQIEEKRAEGLAEWRRRYGGKQRECVVCLEEYIDGVSRVMSLPCGHEFHAECITPWLTTRRRTCPICKGDVVRSLARSANSSSSITSQQQPPHHPQSHIPPSSTTTAIPPSLPLIEDEADIQEQAAVLRNDDPVSAQPVSREDEAFEDLERGVGGVGDLLGPDDRNR